MHSGAGVYYGVQESGGGIQGGKSQSLYLIIKPTGSSLLKYPGCEIVNHYNELISNNLFVNYGYFNYKKNKTYFDVYPQKHL